MLNRAPAPGLVPGDCLLAKVRLPTTCSLLVPASGAGNLGSSDQETRRGQGGASNRCVCWRCRLKSKVMDVLRCLAVFLHNRPTSTVNARSLPADGGPLVVLAPFRGRLVPDLLPANAAIHHPKRQPLPHFQKRCRRPTCVSCVLRQHFRATPADCAIFAIPSFTTFESRHTARGKMAQRRCDHGRFVDTINIISHLTGTSLLSRGSLEGHRTLTSRSA